MLFGNFEIDFKPCDQFQEIHFVWLGGGHHDVSLPRAPKGDKTALSEHILFYNFSYFLTGRFTDHPK